MYVCVYIYIYIYIYIYGGARRLPTHPRPRAFPPTFGRLGGLSSAGSALDPQPLSEDWGAYLSRVRLLTPSRGFGRYLGDRGMCRSP